MDRRHMQMVRIAAVGIVRAAAPAGFCWPIVRGNERGPRPAGWHCRSGAARPPGGDVAEPIAAASVR